MQQEIYLKWILLSDLFLIIYIVPCDLCIVEKIIKKFVTVYSILFLFYKRFPLALRIGLVVHGTGESPGCG